MIEEISGILQKHLGDVVQFGKQQILLDACSKHKAILAVFIGITGYGASSLWANLPMYLRVVEDGMISHPVLTLTVCIVLLLFTVERWK